MSDDAVVLFPTNAHVMRAEKLLHDAGLTCKLVPVPRHLSSDCGVCLSISQPSVETVCSLLNSKQLSYDDIVSLS